MLWSNTILPAGGAVSTGRRRGKNTHTQKPREQEGLDLCILIPGQSKEHY